MTNMNRLIIMNRLTIVIFRMDVAFKKVLDIH